MGRLASSAPSFARRPLWFLDAKACDSEPVATLSEETLDALERASGKLASAALAAMDKQFAWFGRMPADQRASVLYIAQTGAAGFAAWLRDQGEALRLTTDAFRGADAQDLSRRISLRQTVELVRVALRAFERHGPDLPADAAERRLPSAPGPPAPRRVA